MENGDKSGNTYHDSADPGFNGPFSPVFIAGFIKHVLDMGFDSVLGNAQLTGNGRIGHTSGHQAEHFQFPLSKFCIAGEPQLYLGRLIRIYRIAVHGTVHYL